MIRVQSITSLYNTSNLINLTFAARNTSGYGIPGLGSLYGSSKAGSVSGLSSLYGVSATQQAFSDIKSAMDSQQAFNRTELNLRNAAVKLNTANSESAFGETTATSSDADAVAADTNGAAVPGNYEVEVAQVAQGQEVQGNAMDAAAPTTIDTVGSYGQLEFNINGENQYVSFQLNGTETNEEALGKIASAINSRDIGVTAEVNVNETTGEAQLNLTGANGEANAFSVTDTVGNAAAATGLDNPANVTQTAQNAIFTIDGGAYDNAMFSTDSNSVLLSEAGLALEFKAPTGGEPVEISVQGDMENVEDTVRDFVDQYNETMGRLNAETATYAQQSAANLKGISGGNANALRDIGIDVQASGELSINEQRFSEALAERPEDVRDAFSGTSNYAARVQAESERAINQSLASPVTADFSSYFNTSSGYGFNLNSYIANNIGLFLNSYM